MSPYQSHITLTLSLLYYNSLAYRLPAQSFDSYCAFGMNAGLFSVSSKCCAGGNRLNVWRAMTMIVRHCSTVEQSAGSVEMIKNKILDKSLLHVAEFGWSAESLMKGL